MSADTRFNITPSLALGICLIVVGAALALDRMQLADASQILRFWPLAIVLFGVTVVMQALGGGVDEPAAGRRQIGFGRGHIFGILLLGVLITQTLHDRDTTRTDPNDTPHLFAIMSSDQRVSHAASFRGGEMTTVMGSCQLDLRDAMIAPGEEATIDVFGLMGAIVLRVPEGWTVDVRTVPVMGGVEDQRGRPDSADRRRRTRNDVQPELAPPPSIETKATPDTVEPRVSDTVAPRIVVRGFIMMGGLIIKS